MAKTRLQLRNEVATRLGDATLQVWTATELNGYIQEGYNRIAELTDCFWDIGYLENLPYSGDHTGTWEEEYFESGDVFQKEFQFTADWELDYIDNARGPANHTKPWEWQNSYTTVNYIPATVKLPENVYRIERATNNWIEVEPIRSSEIEFDDSNYESLSGAVTGYLQDKDGIRILRKYRAPSSACDYYATSGAWGLIRDHGDLTDETLMGERGIARRIPEQHPIGSERFGFPRRAYQDGANFRIEFYRHGRDLSNDYSELELPDVYCKYVRHYASWKALVKNGPGQDLKLAQHYEQRFYVGVGRIKARKVKTKSNLVGIFGEPGPRRTGKPPRPSLPYHYGRMGR